MDDILIRVSKNDRKTIIQLERVLGKIGIKHNEPIVDEQEMVYWAEVDTNQLQKLRDMNWRGQVNIQEKSMKKNKTVKEAGPIGKDRKGALYVDFDDETGQWCVFGSETGHAYYCTMDTRDAENARDDMARSYGIKAEKNKTDNSKQIIEITEEVKINDDTILEAGDRIEVLNEMEKGYYRKGEFLQALYDVKKEYTEEMELNDVLRGAYFNEELGRLIDEANRQL